MCIVNNEQERKHRKQNKKNKENKETESEEEKGSDRSEKSCTSRLTTSLPLNSPLSSKLRI